MTVSKKTVKTMFVEFLAENMEENKEKFFQYVGIIDHNNKEVNRENIPKNPGYTKKQKEKVSKILDGLTIKLITKK